MTRNRNRKDQARQLQRETGARRAAASRGHDTRKQRSRPVQGLLADAARAVTIADLADATVFLPAAWRAVCVIGAAAELLAECAGTRDYRGRLRLAGQPLSDAVKAMRAVPALRSAPAEVNPAGGPGGRLTGPDAEEIRAAIVTTCDALAGALGRVLPGTRPPSAARACRAVARSARLISGIYQAPPVPPADDGGTAAARPCYLDAGTPDEMAAAIGAHMRELTAADPADTTAALTAAWYGFSLAFVLGQFLASRSPDLAVLRKNAMPAWAQVIAALDAAPALPDGVHGLGLDTVPGPDPALMALAHKGILNLALALNTLLPQVSEHASSGADRAAATACTALAAELGDCYAGRLKTFLSPLGRPLGTASAVIRTQPGRSGPRRGPAPGTAPPPDPAQFPARYRAERPASPFPTSPYPMNRSRRMHSFSKSCQRSPAETAVMRTVSAGDQSAAGAQRKFIRGEWRVVLVRHRSMLEDTASAPAPSRNAALPRIRAGTATGTVAGERLL
jgi:hypothetical protein